jgi:hypothetical protein
LKKIIFSLLLPVLYVFSVGHTKAAENFFTDLTVNYTIDSAGRTQVEELYTVTNLTSQYLISSYDYEIQGSVPENLSGSDSKGPLTIQVQKQQNGNTLLHIIFNDVIAGKNQILHFNLAFTTEFNRLNDETWQIKIPKFLGLNNPDKYTLNLSVPREFGPLAYASSRPDTLIENNNFYLLGFGDSLAKDQDLILTFSKYRAWDIRLGYSYQNKTLQPQYIYLNLPTDNSQNRILITSINPKPQNIIVNKSSFWQAVYEILPGSELMASLSGQIQTLSPSPSFDFENTGINPFYTDYFPGSYIPPSSQISISWKGPRQLFPLTKCDTFMEITNTGNSSGYNLPISAYSEGMHITLSHTAVDVLPPGGSLKIPLSLYINLTDLFRPKHLDLVSGSSHVTYNISARYFLMFYAAATIIISIAFIAVAFIANHTWSIYLQGKRQNNLRR